MSIGDNLRIRLTRFKAEQSGTTMVEFAICIALFLLILFAIMDFGRLGYQWVSGEKAMQRAVRFAAVRPPICAGVPVYHRRSATDTSGAGAGTLCRSGNNICESVSQQCLLTNPDPDSAEAIAAATEIWDQIAALVPPNATRGNVLLRYEYDARLGFLGGPYVPVITAQIVGGIDEQGATSELPFEFVTPLSELAGVAGAANATTMFPESYGGCNACIPFPAISATLPAEDMNQGVKG